jgi:hypothetical protein
MNISVVKKKIYKKLPLIETTEKFLVIFAKMRLYDLNKINFTDKY